MMLSVRYLLPGNSVLGKSCMPLERLQKFLARAGVASRRKCEQLILEGRVTVDGDTVTELGSKVDPVRQEVRYDGEVVRLAKPVYLLLYKPRGFECSARPAQGERSVLELVGGFSQRLFIVGRLDKDSEGLLILTNDGELAARVTHPRYGVPKTYKVTVGGRITDSQLEALRSPEWTSGGKMQLGDVKIVVRGQRRSELEVVLSEGRNREIRRVLSAKGIKVRRLIRTAIGPLTVQGLRAGKYRRLKPDEVDLLRGRA